jgi:rare lipoprotein A (peptidoglycan hydrolase)
MFSGMSQRMIRLFSGIAVAVAAVVSLPYTANAKTPGKTYCFNGVCHRTNTLQEMSELIGKDLTFKTSFYDDCKRDRFNPCGLTASGEVFRPNDADNAASPIYPEGTVLLLRNPKNGQSAVIRVNNAGPYWGNRKLDVSRGVAEELGFKKRGVANLQVRVIAAPTKQEARYKKNRRYDAVPGPIGQFASLAAATTGTQLAMADLTGADLTGRKSSAVKHSGAVRMASADQVSQAPAMAADGLSPADGLRAEARRVYGIDRGGKTYVPASVVASIAPIHKARSRYWAAAQIR